MAKFAADNNKLVFIKFFLFFAIKYLYFYMSFDIRKFSDANTYK